MLRRLKFMLIVGVLIPLIASPVFAASRRSNRTAAIEAQRRLDTSDIEAVQQLELMYLRDQLTKASKALQASTVERLDAAMKYKAELKSTEEKVLKSNLEILRLSDAIRELTMQCAKLDSSDRLQKELIGELETLSLLLIRICNGLKMEIHHLKGGVVEIKLRE